MPQPIPIAVISVVKELQSVLPWSSPPAYPQSTSVLVQATIVMASRTTSVIGTVQRSKRAMARKPIAASQTWIAMITMATAIFTPSPPPMPILSNSAMTRSRMIQVLMAHQPTASRPCMSAGR